MGRFASSESMGPTRSVSAPRERSRLGAAKPRRGRQPLPEDAEPLALLRPLPAGGGGPEPGDTALTGGEGGAREIAEHRSEVTRQRTEEGPAAVGQPLGPPPDPRDIPRAP